MATEAVTRRIIELDVKTSSEALRVMKQQADSMKKFEKQVDSAGASLKQFAIGMASAFTVGAVINGFKTAIDAMDALNDKSQALAISAENLQEWQHAASMSGASAEDMEKGIIGLSKAMAGMDNATDKTTKALKNFGVTADDDVDTALTKLAEGFSKMGDTPQRTAMAMDILGKSGAKLLPMLLDGAAGILKFKQEAHDLGIVMSNETVAAAAKLNDDLDRLRKTALAVGMQLTEGLLPALQNIVTTLLDSGKAGDGWVAVGKKLGDGLINLTALAIATGAAFEGLGLMGSAMWEVISHPLTPYAPVFEKLDKDLQALEKRTSERLGKMRDRYVDTQNAATEFARATASAIDKLVAGPKGGGGGGGPDSEALKQAEAWKKYTEALRTAGLETKTMTEAQKLLLQEQQGHLVVTDKATAALKKQAVAAAAMTDLRARQKAQEAADIAAGEKRNAELEQEIKHTDQMRESFLQAQDPTRALRQQMQELDKVISRTTSEDDLRRLTAYGSFLAKEFVSATEKAARGVNDMHTEFESLGTAVGRQVQSWATDVTDAIVEMARTGKLNVSDMVNSILADLARMLVQRQLQPLFDSLATFAAKSINGSAQGNVFGPTGVQAFASGGVVSGPTFFGMAGGGVGLMGEAGSEAVVPLRRNSSGDLGVSASPVNVTVVNNNGSQIKTEETRSPGGQRDIKIMVDAAVEESIGRGRFDRVMSTAYGVSRKGR